MTRILRAAHRGPALERAPLVEARLDAEAIRARARDHAAQLLEEATREREHITRSAEARGLEQASERLAERMLELAEAHERALADLEQRVVDLGLSAARHILGAELSSRPDAAVGIVGALLAPLRHARQIVITAHPDDCEALRAALSQSVRRAQVTLKSDPSLTRGGALMQSDVGSLDARVETRLETLAKLLKGR